MLNGASPQEAKAIELQTYARESGGTIEAVATSGGKTGRGSFAYDSDDGFWLSNGSDRAFIDYGASMNDVSNFLGNSAARDLGLKFASQVLTGHQKAQQAFDDGYSRGFVSSVRSGVRALQQQQLQTSRQLSAMEQRRAIEIQQTGTFGDYAYGVVTAALMAMLEMDDE